jgi:hypothetical protein
MIDYRQPSCAVPRTSPGMTRASDIGLLFKNCAWIRGSSPRMTL